MGPVYIGPVCKMKPLALGVFIRDYGVMVVCGLISSYIYAYGAQHFCCCEIGRALV